MSSASAYSRKQIAAIKLVIETLTEERRRRFAAGDAAYRSGIRPDKLSDGKITAAPFIWVEHDHAGWNRYSEAIQQLEDLIEIITDPGVTIEPEQISFIEVNNER